MLLNNYKSYYHLDLLHSLGEQTLPENSILRWYRLVDFTSLSIAL